MEGQDPGIKAYKFDQQIFRDEQHAIAHCERCWEVELEGGALVILFYEAGHE